MRRLILICATCAVAFARPELYKESEDFQFSRSSSDDGSKSGYYGAQRGNMGGNYERAHNMDALAQHQMSGLVRQTDGELGDAVNKRAGSVYTAANSRGVFGSGHYDLSNLQGRNFGESSSLAHNSDYSQQSSHRAASQNQRYNGYRSSGGYRQQKAGESQVTEDLNAGAYLHGRNTDQSSGQFSQAGYDRRHEQNFEEANSHSYSATNSGSNAQTRLISSGTPVRIVIRPGTRVVVPVAAQTYDATKTASSFDHNAINSEVEALAKTDGSEYIPNGGVSNGDAKHYESSYSYQKAWEKHDTKPIVAVPLAIPTYSPYPKNSELYDEGQVAQISSDRLQSFDSAAQRRYDANVKSSQSSRARYNAHQQQSSSSALHTGALTNGGYNAGAEGELDSVVGNIGTLDTKPKSYQSSYSYHKSWERQGDPYVIKPASDGSYDNSQIAQKLTNANQASYSTHQRGSRYSQSHQRATEIGNCEDEGQIRVERSANFDDQEESDDFDQDQMVEDLGQQTQNTWDTISQSQKLENFGQQTLDQSESLKDFGQQSQNKWDNLENLGQQTQTLWNLNKPNFEQNQDKLHDFSETRDVGQETQDMLVSSDSNDFSQTIDRKPTSEDQVKPVWEQSADDTQQTSGNWDFYSNSNYKPWMQTQSNSFQQAQSSYNKWNLNSGMSNKHEHDFNSNNNFNSNSNSLQNLWNKINNMENVNALNDKSDKYNASLINNNNNTSFQHSYQSWSQQETNMRGISSANFSNHQITANKTVNQPWQSRENEFKYISTTSQKPNIHEDKTRPIDIGRGDIESVDSELHMYEKPYKTFEEIEALSLSRNSNGKHNIITNETNPSSIESLSVLSLTEQKKTEDQNPSTEKKKFSSSTSTIKPLKPIEDNPYLFKPETDDQHKHQVNIFGTEQKTTTGNNQYLGEFVPVEIEQQNIMEIPYKNVQQQYNLDQSSQSTWVQNLESSQTNLHPTFEDLTQQTQTAWDNRDIEDLSQHSQTVWGQNQKEFGQTQTKVERNFEVMSHQPDYTQSVIQNIEEQGKQSPTAWDKNPDDFNQQSLTTWDKNDENIGQQIQTNYLNQNLNKFGHSQSKLDENSANLDRQPKPGIIINERGQHQENFDHQIQSPWGQNLESFGQQTQWGQDMKDIGQQSQTAWDKPLKDFGQHSETELEQDVKDLTQQSEITWQSTQDKKTEEVPLLKYRLENEKEGRSLDNPNNQEAAHELINNEVKQHRYQSSEQSKDVDERPSVPQEIAEPVTPNPGVWSSFKNKLSTAKDKVSSWFKRS